MARQIILGIVTPANNAALSGSTLKVSGSALEQITKNTEIIGTDPVQLSVSVTGAGTRRLQSVEGGWSLSFNVSTPGPKTITAKATTPSNTATVKHKITIRDDKAPAVRIVQPAQGQTFEGPGPTFNIKISGTAKDQSTIKSVQFRVDNSGRFKNVNKDSGSATNWNWSREITGIGLGQHTISVRATDQHNNTSPAVNRSFTAFRDSGPPEIEITSPNTSLQTGPHIMTWRDGGVSLDVAGTATDRITAVASVQWQLDGGALQDATNISGSWSSWRFSADIPAPGLHDIKVVATDIRDNANFDTVQVDVAIPFELEDIGFSPYLKDLMAFIGNRVRQAQDAAKIDPAALKEAFHQHFDRLTESDVSAAAGKPVAQVRIAIEVLRSFLSNQDPFEDYLETAYHLLLANLGTSFAEIRLARTVDNESRRALARRLGIAVAELDQLFIAPDQLSESGLQGLFGLADTTRDPLTSADDQSELLTFQLSTLQAAWFDQDRAEVASSDFPVPAVDPDLISLSDVKRPVPGNAAHDLLRARTQWVAEQREAIQQERESQPSPIEGFNHVTAQVIGDIDIAALRQQYADGVDIEPQLRPVPLALPVFLVLAGLRQLAETGVVTDNEWADLYDILLQIRKEREFKSWAAEEDALDLVLSPSVFVQADIRRELPTWRSSWRTRRNWEKKLMARIKQREALLQAHNAMISATEEIALPILRDRLIETIDRRGFPAIDVADWLTRRLSISFKYSGDQKISRLEQGVETLQDLMVTLRTGRMGSLADLPVGTQIPQWELALDAVYTEDKFDEEWQWMGSFATWQGAMYAFGYPENYLLPTLRNKVEWTRAFRELIKAVRKAGRLTARKAETIAATYIETLNLPASEEGDGIDFDMILTSRLTKQDLRDRRSRSEAELESHVDGDRGGLKPDTPPHLKEAYFFVPMFLALALQKRGEYLAALDWYQTVYAYELPPGERKIYYGLVAEEKIKTEFRRSPDSWLLDGLDLFEIANDRANALTRFTLLSITRCYLAFGDAAFTRETNESIPFARRLYGTALELLSLLEVPPPIAHWSFDKDEGDTASDATGNGHTMRLNGAQLQEEGMRGSAMGFGGGSAEVSHSAALALGQSGSDFSLSFALFFPLTATDALQPIVRKGTGDNRTPELALQSEGDGLRIRYQVHTIVNTNEGGTSNSVIEPNAWVPVALVKQRQILKLYVNGQFDSETALSGDTVGFDVPLIFGGGFGGALDDIRIFDQALAAEAVIALAGIDRFPPNPVMNALQRHGDLNLQKLRNGQNIAGLERIRTEPEAAQLLIGDGGLAPPPASSLRPTIYRYTALIERAKQLVTIAQQMEANFFAALEKRDAEAYTLLNAQHDVQLTKETVALQDIRLKEADSQIELMTLHQDRAQIQLDTYNEWINAGANQYEQAMLSNYRDLKEKRDILADLDIGIAIAGAALQVTQAAYGKEGAAVLAASTLGTLNVEKALFSRGISALEFEAQKNAFNGNLERRKDEWRLQSALAQLDTQIADQQIFQAEINKRIVEQERAIAGIRSDQAQAVVEFLNTKFTNVELYEWMSDILSEVYNYFLQQATAMAQMAANQLAFERQERPPAFIRSDYWQAPNDAAVSGSDEEAPDRRGITGSARLLQDIFQLDQHAFETNQRKLQLTESFSLARLTPFEFQEFRRTGVLPFSTSMALFDQGFPGHYLRLIKRVRISVVGLIPPTQGIRATLSAAGVSHVMTGGEVYRRTAVRRPSDAIAFTSPSNATGLFELQPENELLLPFETMGVDATWELQLPKAANRFNFDTIADVIFTIDYTALHSDDYRQQVIEEMDRSFKAERAYSIRRDFPDLWYHLNHPDMLVDEESGLIEAQMILEQANFPPNLTALSIDHLILQFVRSDGIDFELEMADLRYKGHPDNGTTSFGPSTSMQGVISTRRANATGWLPLIGQSPVGTWTFAFTDTPEFRRHFSEEQITDVLFVIGYSGETPPWP